MTPQERDLIQGVFDRLARAGTGPKDPDAEALIRDGVRRLPDAPYALVQAVIVQEMGLNQATQRINDLQRQLDEARSATAPAGGGGSFLGNAGPWGGGSVPRSGQPAPQTPSPVWGPQPAAPAAPAASPWAQQQQQQQVAPMGGFLRNAATMAAGVAGGTLIAEGLSSLFGGHHFGGGYGGGGFAGGSPWGGGQGGVVEENVTTVNNYYGGSDTQDAGDQDSGVQDASYDDSSFDDGGGFDSGTDV